MKKKKRHNLFGRMAAAWRGLSSPSEWLFDSLTGNASTGSGVRVTESNVLQITAVWACVRVISETVGSLPLFVYKRVGSANDRERNDSHPLYPLLHVAPNSDMSAMAFRETLTMHLLTWGNGYAEIKRDNAGRPIELSPILPSLVQIERSLSGELVYVIREPSNPRIEANRILGENMLHISGPSPDGVVGYSPVTLAREMLGLTKAGEQYAANVYGNDSRPSGVLTHPMHLEPEAAKQLKSDWEGMYKGASNAGKTAVLEEGMTFNAMSFPPEDAQMLESRQFQTEEVARWFNVPPHKIQHLLRATFSNIEQQQISFSTDTIRPWLVRWEQEMQRKLFNADDDSFSEHVLDALLRGDSLSRAQSLEIQFRNGVRSPNEWRAIENLNAFDGGDKHYRQMNMTAIEGEESGSGETPDGDDSVVALESPPADPTLDAEVDDSLNDDTSDRSSNMDAVVRSMKPLLSDVLRRIIKTEADKVSRAVRREGDLFTAWRDKFYAEHRSYVWDSLAPQAVAFLTVARMSIGNKDPINKSDLTLAVNNMVAHHCDKSMQDIDAISGGLVVKRTKDWTSSDRADDESGYMMFDLVKLAKGKYDE